VIVTLTPNPSLDRTLEVDDLVRGGVHRAVRTRTEPGGKGINVARALRAAGVATTAVVPAGGAEGEQLLAELRDLGLDVVPVPITGSTRANVSVVERDGTTTKINAAGPELAPDEVDALLGAARAAADGATWFAACGSLPPGAPDELYADLVRHLHARGVRVAIDASGAPLRAAVAAGPDLIKPNTDELAELTGTTLCRLGDVLDAAATVRSRGVGTVVVSLGADGAVLLTADGAWHATTPPVAVRSTVGAGDSVVAGLLSADQLDPAALARGVAFGAAAAALPGTQLPTPDDLHLDAVEVTDPDPDRPLREPGGTR
jgi:1-phosphofructokinase